MRSTWIEANRCNYVLSCSRFCHLTRHPLLQLLLIQTPLCDLTTESIGIAASSVIRCRNFWQFQHRLMRFTKCKMQMQQCPQPPLWKILLIEFLAFSSWWSVCLLCHFISACFAMHFGSLLLLCFTPVWDGSFIILYRMTNSFKIALILFWICITTAMTKITR